jgi:hypothetical protein
MPFEAERAWPLESERSMPLGDPLANSYYFSCANCPAKIRVRLRDDRVMVMAIKLTDEQETLLANLVEQARDRAWVAWKASIASDRESNSEAFDRGFEAAMDFALSNEFEVFISRLKSMLEGDGPSRH